MCRVNRNAINRTNLDALAGAEVADAFGAAGRIDLVYQRSLINRIVGTFGLANVAINAFVGNDKCHGVSARLWRQQWAWMIKA